jgi:hypothetical protein
LSAIWFRCTKPEFSVEEVGSELWKEGKPVARKIVLCEIGEGVNARATKGQSVKLAAGNPHEHGSIQ